MKKLLGILVLGLLLSGNAYSEIHNFKCSVKEQKFGDGKLCSNCGSDDGLSFDLDNNIILVSPYIEDDLEHYQDKFIIKNSSKYFEWTHPTMGHKFKFNKFTFELDHRQYTGSNNMNVWTGEVKYPRAFFFKVLYKCSKINKI